MAFTPESPFPKARGHVIRSKDWNDAITEVQRLDTAKVNRTGDAITGGLTIGGHAGVGTATPENAEGWDRVLDVVGSQHAKFSVRSAAIEGRMMAHGGFWGAPAGMVVGTNTDHALSFGTNRSSRMTIDRAGLVGIGVGAQPQARLHVAGGQGDIGLTEGDLKVGDANFRLKVGVTTAGADAGNVRIRAHGGTNRLVLGGGTSDALTIAGANLGIGTLTLMIVGNRSAGISGPGLGRRVSVWDILEVNGNLRLATNNDIFLRAGTDVG